MVKLVVPVPDDMPPTPLATKVVCGVVDDSVGLGKVLVGSSMVTENCQDAPVLTIVTPMLIGLEYQSTSFHGLEPELVSVT